MTPYIVIRDRDSGRVKLDSTLNSGNILGFVNIGGAGASAYGSVRNNDFSLGTPFYAVMDGGVNFTRENVMPDLGFNYSESVPFLEWYYPHPLNQQDWQRPRMLIMYGVY